jgi:hypothetical protein
MQQSEKKYLKCILNADDADFSVAQDEVINSENVRFGSTDAGIINTIESIGSTTLLSQIQPSVSTVVIGSTDDTANNRIVYFVADLYGNDDKILCYFIDDSTIYTVLLNAQVTGGLNFDKNVLIHSARIVDGLLYWVQGVLNEPRKIDIDAGIKLNHPSYATDAVAYTAPLDWREITIIKPPPPLAPNIQKENDSSFANNFIADESFMFAYQYVYYDNEETVVGTYSPATRLNKVTDNYNRVIVQMDIGEVIPQSVRIVNLIVRYGNAAFVVKTWDKQIATENTELQNQNNGGQVLTFLFYNNVTGQALTPDLILKPFDSVPIYSKALEIAKNRLFLGNNVEGYDAPLSTSLSYSLTTVNIQGGTTLNKNLIEVMAAEGSLFLRDQYSAYYVYITELAPAGYYALTSTEQFCMSCSPPPPALPPPPGTVAIAGLTFRGATQADAIASAAAAYGITLNVYTFTTISNTVSITGTTISTYDIFKTRAQYKLGVVFYDYAMRKCGVVTKPFTYNTADPTLVSIPARNFNFTQGISAIAWALSNTDALNEIPDWAHYYTVVRTLNLRTRYFINVFEQNLEAKYVTRDADGNYVFTNNTFVTGAIGIGIDTTAMIQAGLGYTFTQGDVCYINTEGFSPSPPETNYTVAVIGQSGKYIIVNTPQGGIGDLSTFKFFYEIYTPYRASAQEPYYEVGNMYKVLNPRTGMRQYGTLTDVLLPDAYALTRNYDSFTYFAETMSPNDRFYNRWDNDTGKVNLIVKSGQNIKEQSISFSNTYIPGTGTNGLSTFEALNESSVALENGALNKLILTSKTQDQGDVMLAICENETTSIYLGETQIIDSTGGTQFFASSTGVIGTKNNLKGSFGTINPESVSEFRGNVYWVDLLNGKIIQYSANGLFPISNYKMTRYWKLFADQFTSMTQQEIEDLGNRPFIFATVDPHHWELLISVPKLLQIPPKGTLPDYPFINYPFDIYDGQAKTLVFKINAEPNHWQGAYKFCAEGFITIQNKLLSFKYGQLYEHNSLTSQCEFYGGARDKARIMFLSNTLPEVPKSYNNMAVQANMKPTFTYLYNDYPYQQSSDLISDDFRSLEGVFYSSIYRNKLIPTATGYNINGLLTGEKMRAEALKIMLEFDVSQKQLEFRFIDIGYSISSGHTTIK